MNKYARAIRDEYGVPYSTALQWVRENGPEGAINRADAVRALRELKEAEGDGLRTRGAHCDPE